MARDWDLVIHRYLDGSLPEREASEFEAELGEDPELRKRLAVAAFDQAQMPRMLQAAEVRREVAAAVTPPPSRGRRWSLAAAAAILLAVGSSWLLWELRPDASPARRVSGRVQVGGREVERIPRDVAVKVGSEDPAELRMEDGSQASLAPASEAIFRGPADGARQIVELVEGEGTFKVVPGSKSFRVDTVLGRVTVLGTEFSVDLRSTDKARPKSRPSRMRVSVRSGSVSVEAGGQLRRVRAGESVDFGEPAPPAARGFRGVVAGEVVGPKTEFGFGLKVLRIVRAAPESAAGSSERLLGTVVRVSGDRVKKPDPASSSRWEGAFIRKLQVGQSLEIDVRFKEKDDYLIGELTPEQIQWAQQRDEPPKPVDKKK